MRRDEGDAGAQGGSMHPLRLVLVRRLDVRWRALFRHAAFERAARVAAAIEKIKKTADATEIRREEGGAAQRIAARSSV